MDPYLRPLLDRIEAATSPLGSCVDFRRVRPEKSLSELSNVSQPTPEDYARLLELALQLAGTNTYLKNLLGKAHEALVFAGPPEPYQ